jgi:hypothetical protein
MPADAIALRPLDERGLKFVLDHLRGVNVMCAALLDLAETRAGEVFTCAPPEVPDDQLYAFHQGGLLPINRDFSRAVSLGPGLGQRCG